QRGARLPLPRDGGGDRPHLQRAELLEPLQPEVERPELFGRRRRGRGEGDHVAVHPRARERVLVQARQEVPGALHRLSHRLSLPSRAIQLMVSGDTALRPFAGASPRPRACRPRAATTASTGSGSWSRPSAGLRRLSSLMSLTTPTSTPRPSASSAHIIRPLSRSGRAGEDGGAAEEMTLKAFSALFS